MKPHGNRARLGGVLLVVALGAVALLALPAIGIGHGGDRGPHPAGTISSFDPETGVLTVGLAKGGEISARVVRRTHIRCGEGGKRHRRHRHRRGSGHDDASASSRGSDHEEDSSGSDSDEDRRGSDDDDDDRSDDRDRDDDDHGDDDGGRHDIKAGEDHHGDGHRGDRGRHGCNRGDLVEGAVVIKAEIVLTHGSAFFKKIGLLPPQAVTTAPEPEEPEGL